MQLTEKTKLKDILNEYPWLIDEAVQIDEQFKKLRSPLGKLLIAKADIAEASRRTGVDAGTIIEKIDEMIEAHRQ